MSNELRNICIIAHVDHGKTTLVDFILKQAGTFARENNEIRILDSDDQERERGITILAKNASVRLGDVKVNIIDTPGHADFGGEVERIMNMADGAILLVDAAEGALPQTRFVLEKAIRQGLKIALFINKIDRPEVQRNPGLINSVIDKIFDLFIELGASNEQAEFPILVGCGRQGWCSYYSSDTLSKIGSEEIKSEKLAPLFDLIINKFPSPKTESCQDFRLLVTNIFYSDFVGQMAVGKVLSGSVGRGDLLTRIGKTGKNQIQREDFNCIKLASFEGLEQKDIERSNLGDIVLIAGSSNFEIGDTISSNHDAEPLERIEVEKPTIGMIFSINTSPLSGQEGEAVQSRKLRELLLREVRANVALKFEETDSPDRFRLLGRGELQFAILIEKLRREGFEFMVGKPVVLIKTDENGNKLEPVERAVLDIPEQYIGDVSELFQKRRGILSSYETIESSRTLDGQVRVRVCFEIPTRGILGIRSYFLTVTRGEGLFSSELIGYEPYRGELVHRNNGCLICDRDGECVEYSLLALEPRGVLFVTPGVKVYEGMIIGECSRGNDLDVNPCKERKLTNVRSTSKDAFVTLKPPKPMPLEKCLEWLDDDEWVEITPVNIRLRKKILNKTQRHIQKARN